MCYFMHASCCLVIPMLHVLPPRASSGFNVQLQQLGATVGELSACVCTGVVGVQLLVVGGRGVHPAVYVHCHLPCLPLLISFLHPNTLTGASFAFSCGSNSSNQIAAAATATPNAHHHTACSSELQVTVDFTHLRLLLGPDAATLGSNSTTTATARPHTGGHNTGSLTRVYDNNSSSSNSQTQSQHPLGASPPHTPNKTHSSSNGSAAAGSNGSNSSAAATTATAAAGGGVMSPPKPVAARQLEAVLLSHSPRMLVIDNFFLPGTPRRWDACCQSDSLVDTSCIASSTVSFRVCAHAGSQPTLLPALSHCVTPPHYWRSLLSAPLCVGVCRVVHWADGASSQQARAQQGGFR